MKVVSVRMDCTNLLAPKISYPDGLPDSVANECAILFPNLLGIVAGMSMDSFELIMSMAALNAKNQFIQENGTDFGTNFIDRRQSDSPLRTIIREDNIVEMIGFASSSVSFS